MPVGAGRKLFITDRSQYYRDYYQVHKHEYKERYLKSKEKRASGPGNTWGGFVVSSRKVSEKTVGATAGKNSKSLKV
jgi:hypothetical protein